MTVNRNLLIRRFGYGTQINDVSSLISKPYEPELKPNFTDNLSEIITSYAIAQKNKDMDTIKEITKVSFSNFIYERVRIAINSPISFHERLVHFWSNHFAISTDKRSVTLAAGSYEFSAIRPNINRNFKTLLIAAITHPAMLEYLDQEKSTGPNSVAAQNAAKKDKIIGLNENLAREILELHTLGVNGGYTQKDVTEFAKALTGFNYQKPPPQKTPTKDNTPNVGGFKFLPQRHEPGIVNFMGKEYAQQKQNQAFAIIDYISTHPKTAEFISFKLAKHFCKDAPPHSLINNLSQKFMQTGGDLNSLYEVLLNSSECFTNDASKFKSPWDWYISSLRALGINDIDAQTTIRITKILGQEVFAPKSPKGYDDIQGAWAAPDAILKRAEVANLLAKKYLPPQQIDTIAQKLFNNNLSEQTKKTISRAESKQSAISLLLISPENMRR